jgi:uncharacterized protein (DUF433 family)
MISPTVCLGQVTGQVRNLLMAIQGEQSKKELMAAMNLTIEQLTD